MEAAEERKEPQAEAEAEAGAGREDAGGAGPDRRYPELKAPSLELPLSPEEEKEGIRRLQNDSEAMRRLHEENMLLKKTLAQFQRRMSNQGAVSAAHHDGADGESASDAELKSTIGSLIELQESLGTEDGTRSFYEQLKAHVDSPAFLATLEENQAVVVGNADQGDEVGVVDLDDVEWWTLVQSPDKVRSVEDCSLSGSYVFVEKHDVIEAIGEFVALYMAQVPNAQQLSPEELQALLSGTFAEFKEKGMFDNLWSWGRFLYATYGWGMTGLSMYRDPGMALYIMRALWTASKWACFLVAV